MAIRISPSALAITLKVASAGSSLRVFATREAQIDVQGHGSKGGAIDLGANRQRHTSVQPNMPDWILHERLFVMLGMLSVATFVASLVLMPILVARLPIDYFQYSRRRHPDDRQRHPAVHMLAVALKNSLGFALLLAGIAMLVLPGQGILTILIAIALMDFPGKYRLEKAIVRRAPVFDALNWIRRKAGVPALLTPD